MSAASHRARKKRADGHVIAAINNELILTNPHTKSQWPAFPLVAFLLPARGTVSLWVVLPLTLMAVGLFRWATGFWGYSGQGKPPMFGDYEAQRHWLEVTTQLPVSHWYFHDLQWWGLDYPPLTAYHSWVLGKVADFINPAWVELRASRGLESQGLKVFMRATVFVSEYLIYVPACVICLRRLGRLTGVATWDQTIALTAILMQPATMLIDHGHFQYNTVMLGLVTACISSMLAGRHLWSCAYFVAALGFKQMALFYAPAVFAYLLGICVFPRIDILRLVAIALATLVSFAVLYLPFLLGVAYDAYRSIPLASDIEIPSLLTNLPIEPNEKAWYYPMLLQFAQSIHRIFPFARGLFEDKVANIWCAVHSSGLHKLHRYDTTLVSRAALALTSLLILPPCILIFLKPKKQLVPLAFATTAWGFFLASYQVHEKNVLLPLLPMTLLLGSGPGLLPEVRAWVGFANMLGVWTMYPLLERDELTLPYLVLVGLWAYLLSLPPVSFDMYFGGAQGKHLSMVVKLVHLLFYAGGVWWHIGQRAIAPPASMPDLWVVGNVCLGTAGFVLCYLWCLWQLTYQSGIFKVKEVRSAEDAKKKQ
ncbi:hypothetical protein AAFC00_000352 [Neodothiora populina]|uniref:Alpha-1,3-glucosyltransferase n=1 Tax=Neodothiora populina TaxID=2781224 RepID=A0ABR3PCM1_9PEZI